MTAPLLLAYDAESPACRGVVDWIRKRDRDCLTIAFPLQNAELVQLAPELAGLPLIGTVHGLDTRTREVRQGQALLPAIFLRLPGWRWAAPLVGMPFFAGMAYAMMRRAKP